MKITALLVTALLSTTIFAQEESIEIKGRDLKSSDCSFSVKRRVSKYDKRNNTYSVSVSVTAAKSKYSTIVIAKYTTADKRTAKFKDSYNHTFVNIAIDGKSASVIFKNKKESKVAYSCSASNLSTQEQDFLTVKVLKSKTVDGKKSAGFLSKEEKAKHNQLTAFYNSLVSKTAAVQASLNVFRSVSAYPTYSDCINLSYYKRAGKGYCEDIYTRAVTIYNNSLNVTIDALINYFNSARDLRKEFAATSMNPHVDGHQYEINDIKKFIQSAGQQVVSCGENNFSNQDAAKCINSSLSGSGYSSSAHSAAIEISKLQSALTKLKSKIDNFEYRNLKKSSGYIK